MKPTLKVLKSLIPDHNLLVGGFPCQDYSVARSLNGAMGIEGKKGALWWQIRDVLIAKKPSFVLLENVDRLIKSPASQRGRDFGIMLATFNMLDYSVEWRVVNAADYGAAQRRRRIFIFAYKNSTEYAKKMTKITFDDSILRNGYFANVFPIKDSEKTSEIDLNGLDLVEISNNFTFDFQNSGKMSKGKVVTKKVSPKTENPIKLKDILEQCVDEKYYIKEGLEKWKILKGAKKIERTSKTGHKYIFSEGAISFPDNINLPARTMLTSESSVNRSSHIIEDPNTGRLRILTPIEAERIQGFEDDWTNKGMPEKFRYFCMGNALVVPMVTRMGNYLNKIIEAEL